MTGLPENFDLRFTDAEDIVSLRSWINERDILHWFPMSTPKEIDPALQAWIGFSKFNASLTAMVDGEVCGIGTLFLMPYKKVAHECLVKMIVAPKWQRVGIGRSLLRNLMHLAETRFHLEICYFELVEGNPLEKLLISLGYVLEARQEGYFKEEDRYFARLIYARDLKVAGWK